MPFLNARVDDDTKKAWKALAKATGRSESELLKQAVQAILRQSPGAANDAGTGEQGSEPEPTDGSIRLPLMAHELAAIETQAKRLGWRRNRWLVNLVRTTLLKEPRPTDGELAALGKATVELRAVGRNLNQIAHAIHRDDRYKDSVTASRLDAVREAVSLHTTRMGALLAAIENRWDPSAESSSGFRPETSEEDG